MARPADVPKEQLDASEVQNPSSDLACEARNPFSRVDVSALYQPLELHESARPVCFRGLLFVGLSLSAVSPPSCKARECN